MNQAPESPEPDLELPRYPIDRLRGPVMKFLHVEAASGVVLMLAALVALALANSPWGEAFVGFWKTKVGISIGDFRLQYSLEHWINDGLMAIFFFVVGLEIKWEIAHGQLRDIRRATLPVAAAIGGMMVPALLYTSLQYGKPTAHGWGIPMATDIAFVVGCMAILGKRVPLELRVFLLTLAIVDDIGAIVVIAVGYSEGVDLQWLMLGGLGLLLVFVLLRLGVRRIPVYVFVGLVVWYAVHESGVHATIAGVILGLAVPATTEISEGGFRAILRRASQVFESGQWSSVDHRAEKIAQFQQLARETISPVEYLQGMLHPWSSFVIMPLFALCNADIPLRPGELTESLSLAVIFGLVVGKPLGIVLASWLAVKSGRAELPRGVSWKVLSSAACLGGIGFTMAIFIAGLAFKEPHQVETAKVGILAASVIAASVGMVLLVNVLPKPSKTA